MPTETFDFTGSEQTWDPPSDVFVATITLIGASGANGENGADADGGDGGLGAEIVVDVDIDNTQTYRIYVGGEGAVPSGGWPNGGDGGSGGNNAGGSGGSTDIRDGPGTADRIAVAGAGGGGGAAGTGDDTGAEGGDGGNANVPDGADGAGDFGTQGGGGGEGATQSSPGSGGGSGGTSGSSGDDGSTNGDGGNGADGGSDAGGGGAGGFMGGGGGGSGGNDFHGGGGGGGGSTWWDSEANLVSSTDASNTGDGQVVIEWPDPPENLAVDDERETEIDLYWDASPDADEYKIYRHDDADPFENGSEVGSVLAPTTTFTDDDSGSGLTNGKQYHYQVTAVDSDGVESGPTGEVNGTTLLPTTEIDDVVATDHRELTVSWTKADDNDTGDFELFRSDTDGNLGSSIGTFGPAVTEHTDTGLDHGTTYFYTLRRSTDDVSDVDSLQQSGTTTVPDPTNLTVDSAQFDTRVVIDFDDATEGEARHEVQARLQGRDWETEADLDVGETGPIESRELAPNRDNESVVEVRVRAYIE